MKSFGNGIGSAGGRQLELLGFGVGDTGAHAVSPAIVRPPITPNWRIPRRVIAPLSAPVDDMAQSVPLRAVRRESALTTPQHTGMGEFGLARTRPSREGSASRSDRQPGASTWPRRSPL